MSKDRIAVPSMIPGGLVAQRSGHFGRCDMFTLIDIEDGKIISVNKISNVEHSEGGCLVPVNLLAGFDVNALVVSGMGMRPLMGFKDAGIKVYLGTGDTVEDCVLSYISGNLMPMSEEYVCGGH